MSFLDEEERKAVNTSFHSSPKHSEWSFSVLAPTEKTHMVGLEIELEVISKENQAIQKAL